MLLILFCGIVSSLAFPTGQGNDYPDFLLGHFITLIYPVII